MKDPELVEAHKLIREHEGVSELTLQEIELFLEEVRPQIHNWICYMFVFDFFVALRRRYNEVMVKEFKDQDEEYRLKYFWFVQGLGLR